MPVLQSVRSLLELPGANGIEATRELRRRYPECPVVIISVNDSAAAHPGSPRKMTANVLLADDDKAALYALSEVLSDLGVRLLLAESGEDALRQVLKHEFAAILLDVRLPKMDGFEAAAEDYLRKPLSPALVRSKVAGLIEPAVVRS